jgi:hypothetical protein
VDEGHHPEQLGGGKRGQLVIRGGIGQDVLIPVSVGDAAGALLAALALGRRLGLLRPLPLELLEARPLYSHENLPRR